MTWIMFLILFWEQPKLSGLVCLPWCGPQGIKSSFSMVLYTGMIKNDLGLITLLGCLLIEWYFSVLYYKGNIFFKAQSTLGTVLLQCIHKRLFKFVLYSFFMSLNHIQKKSSQHSQTSVFFPLWIDSEKLRRNNM